MLSCRGSQDVIPDEIALRDEILELKRQVMILKRTNQQNLIKFRKYEDEAKRKDRQIEQLMDPRKVGLWLLFPNVTKKAKRKKN